MNPKEKNLIKRGRKVLFAVAYIVLLSVQIYSQKLMNIEGYLVNADDKPVRNGLVTAFYVPPIATNDGLIESWETFEDGLFGLQVAWHPGKKIMLLMEERLKGFYPIEKSRLINRRFFKGVIISKFKKEKNLHKVRDYIRYGQTLVDIKNSSDLFVEKVLRNEIYLKVRTTDGYIVCDTSFAPAYSKESKELVFQLPEGIWYIEIMDMSVGKIVLPYTRVAVMPSKPAKILLTTY